MMLLMNRPLPRLLLRVAAGAIASVFITVATLDA
jgi:hypothetical protein